MPWLGGGGVGVAAASKIPFLDNAESTQGTLPTTSDQGGGVTRLTIPSAGSAAQLPHQSARWFFQAVDTDDTNLTGPPHDYDLEFGIRATAAGGGVLPQDVWAAILLLNLTDPSTASLLTSTAGFGVSLYGSSATEAAPSAIVNRSGWNEGDSLETPPGDSAIRVAYGYPRPSGNASGPEAYSGFTAYGMADFASAQLKVGSFETEANPGALDMRVLAVCVGYRAAIGADVDIDVEAYFRATRLLSADRGLTARGFV